MRSIADSVGAWLLSDMAHISGLVSSGVVPSPFDHSDIVTTTTHKSLRGPRGAMIFYRKGKRGEDKKGNDIMYDIEEKVRRDTPTTPRGGTHRRAHPPRPSERLPTLTRAHGKKTNAQHPPPHRTPPMQNQINFAVFPGLQGGPHNHTIAALATALKQAKSAEFVAYQKQVLANASQLASSLQSLGYNLVSGGTDNHLVLVDLKSSKSIDGARVERILEMACIATNKNTIPGDKSALTPGGIRMGAPALTSREFKEADFAKVAAFFDRGVKIAMDVKATPEGNKLKGFREACATKGTSVHPDLAALRADVMEFANGFPAVGFEEEEMEHKGTYMGDLAA